MQIFGVPSVAVRTTTKLHISQSPGLISWLSILAAGYVGNILTSWMFEDESGIKLIAGVAIGVFLALWQMEKWVDIVIDREVGHLTALTLSCYHLLPTLVPSSNVIRIPIQCIRRLRVGKPYGIDIISNDGKAVKILMDCSNKRRLRCLRKEISTFLNLELLVNLSHWEQIQDHWTDFNQYGDDCEVIPCADYDSDTGEGAKT